MPTLIWDFDGTLGYRDGGGWAATMLELLDREELGHAVILEQLRASLQAGFPWQDWERPHPYLVDADGWWEALQPTLTRTYCGAGLDAARAAALVRQFRAAYLNPARWRAFEDTHPTLDVLAAAGWTHILLTNHVPELRAIVQHVGLTPYFTHIFNSAETGYEKPHPRAFEMVLAALGEPSRPSVQSVQSVEIWMIGDSFTADVQGAEAAGIPGILVRRPYPEARYYCETLAGVADIVQKGVKIA